LAAGTYHVTVVGDEHGNTHRGIATFQVAGAAVAPPPSTDQGPRGLVGDAPPPPRTVSTGSVGIHRIRGTAAPSATATPAPAAPAPAAPAPAAPAPAAPPPAATTAGPSAGSATTLAGATNTATSATVPPPRPDGPPTATRAPYRIRSAGTFVIAC
jgi:hypothetical protein